VTIRIEREAITEKMGYLIHGSFIQIDEVMCASSTADVEIGRTFTTPLYPRKQLSRFQQRFSNKHNGDIFNLFHRKIEGTHLGIGHIIILPPSRDNNFF